ncbi:MAG: hypothetical protein AAFX55_11305 [Bacteroidota bacterium]
MNKIIFPLLISLFLFGCNEKETAETVEIVNQEYGDIPAQLIDSLQLISGANQEFKIDNTKSNTIVGNKGTILIIPENSITDPSGNKMNGEIIIELKENFTIQDFITSNLQTIHNDQILESKGMIYFSAKDENSNRLKIADNTSIRIQIPQKDLNNDPDIFLGVRDEVGLINWEQKEEPTKSLVPYPIKFISKNRFPTECSDYYGITEDTIKNKYYNYYGQITDFENTLLATKEFADRYHSTCWEDVIKIYIENLDKNLWEIDEMVVEYFVQDSIERVEYQINSIHPGPNGGPRTKEQKEAHEWLVNNAKEHGRWTIQLYKMFASQKLTKIDTTKLIDTTELQNINTAMISYDAMKFGWVNVDFFYEDPKAVPIKLIAKTNQKAPLINLIINGRNVILSGSEHSENEYWFTKNKDGYNKLPKGEKATIIAIGLNQTELQYGEKEIVIGESEIEDIEMTAVSGNELKIKLEKYGS